MGRRTQAHSSAGQRGHQASRHRPLGLPGRLCPGTISRRLLHAIGGGRPPENGEAPAEQKGPVQRSTVRRALQTFTQWAEAHQLALSPVSESALRRAGIAHWAYPDGYVRSHYPDGYFMPTAADAIQKMSPGPPMTPYKHHVSHETPPDYAIGPDGKIRPERRKDYKTY